VFGPVVGHGLRLSVLGMVLGLGSAFAVIRVMRTMLVGVSPADPLTITSTAALFLRIAFLACSLPALRASRLDPTAALREE
jgi:ABC-type antimicrobial peptide transport system permease subunit